MFPPISPQKLVLSPTHSINLDRASSNLLNSLPSSQLQKYAGGSPMVPLTAKKSMHKELSYALALDDLEEASHQREEVARRRNMIREIRSFKKYLKRLPELKNSHVWPEVVEF